MTVTLRVPVGPDYELVCDFGEIVHSDARADRGAVGELMTIGVGFVEQLLTVGPQTAAWGGTWSAVEDPETGELSAVLTYDEQSWEWELFEARWSDGKVRMPIYVGKWPSPEPDPA
jgi:hypothetical protein